PYKEIVGGNRVYYENIFSGDEYHKVVSLVSYNDFIVDVIQQMDEPIYYGYLEDIVAFGPRVTGTSSCYNTGTYLYNEFANMGLTVRYHNWTYSGYSDRNIEATLPGTNSSSDQIFIIFGHYDTVGNCPGADDDASGVATVLAAAYILRQFAFDHTIRFVAFSGEEQWMLGSHEYVVEAYNNGDNIIGVLNVDMIGFALTASQGSQLKVYKNIPSLWLCDYTQMIAETYYDYIEITVLPLGEAASDQLYFWEYGYDGLFYHEYEFNYYYHTPQDTIANMNISYAVKCSKLVLATLASLARLSSTAPETPGLSGENQGIAGQSYDFTIVTTDPDGDNIYYLIDWGDGSSSGWVGPFASGEQTILSHIWNIQGQYTLRGKAKDTYNVESDWSEPLTIQIVGDPVLDITAINGGLFTIKTTIKNRGETPATNINWSITLDGGAFIGKQTSGYITNLDAGDTITVHSSPVIGLGATKVTVSAVIPGMSDERSQSGFILLFLIMVNPGGGI
ncbi:MAG: M28 family peptidase, partial [Candidatus Thermoplasmatota archaeon]|nr:M28 family peptidase [Candidatus Thermoplasmatota archaeon]